jgi:4-hydroxy-3-polyprenylbenzoate decarboxylase
VRLIVGMTGATGAVFGMRLLENLRELPEVETHLVLSRWARTTIELEIGISVAEISALADVSYNPDDQGAAISSGSFKTDGMVIVPCSMKTLAGIRVGYAEGLVARAADVVLKERRPLVLVPRETPLSAIHLENMLRLTRAGATILPASPGFYHRPTELGQLVDFVVARVLDHLGVEHAVGQRWGEMPGERDA